MQKRRKVNTTAFELAQFLLGKVASVSMKT